MESDTIALKMTNPSGYVPPAYIPIGQSDSEADIAPNNQGCIGLFCPCYLFGKNAEFLSSGTFIGSCATHFILLSLLSSVCCFLTDGIWLGLPGCFVACYACRYRKALRDKYKLQEAPCGDFITHFCCHLCANCQEYREIRERSSDSKPTNSQAIVTAPTVHTM